MSKRLEQKRQELARRRGDALNMHAAIRAGDRDYERDREQFEAECETMAELTPELCARDPKAEALRRHFMARAKWQRKRRERG